ncbi:MAG: hypothetical protein HFE81_06235 [Bacilli bacterium]|nr:hypothetical protein [Bacilli bacterium]
MPAIGDFSYGYDTSGVEGYLDAIKADAIEQAKEAVLDISEIKSCCEAEWEGKARENFVTNLTKDSQHVAEQFDALYAILTSEINSLNAAMANKDETLINVG